MDNSQNVCYTDVHVFELIKTSDFHKYLYILHNVSFTYLIWKRCSKDILEEKVTQISVLPYCQWLSAFNRVKYKHRRYSPSILLASGEK